MVYHILLVTINLYTKLCNSTICCKNITYTVLTYIQTLIDYKFNTSYYININYIIIHHIYINY